MRNLWKWCIRKGPPVVRHVRVCLGCPLLVGFQENSASLMFLQMCNTCNACYKHTNVCIIFPFNSQLLFKTIQVRVCGWPLVVYFWKRLLSFFLDQIQNIWIHCSRIAIKQGNTWCGRTCTYYEAMHDTAKTIHAGTTVISRSVLPGKTYWKVLRDCIVLN